MTAIALPVPGLPFSSRFMSVRAVARHALPTLIETTAIPIVMFSTVAAAYGMRSALTANLVWTALVFVRHLSRGRRVPGTMVVNAVDTIARCLILVFNGGAFLFFAQPILGTVATALAFLVSSVTGRPLAALLGADFLPVARETWRDPNVVDACRKLSRIWGIALAANAAETLWVLTAFGPRVYVISKLGIAATTTLPAVVLSAVVARRIPAMSR